MTASDGLRIGFVPGVTLTKWRRIWGERYRARLEIVAVAEADQRHALDSRLVDMCFVRLPIERDGLHLIPLYKEQPVLWLSRDHILAALEEITAADLAEDATPVIFDADPSSIELATYSAAVLRVPLSVARSGSRKDMLHLPVVDAEPTTVGLAWRTDNEHPLLEDFVGVVRGRTANSTRTAQAKGKTPPPTKAATRRRPADGRQSGRRPRRR